MGGGKGDLPASSCCLSDRSVEFFEAALRSDAKSDSKPFFVVGGGSTGRLGNRKSIERLPGNPFALFA
jgi:hypothetical protein